MAERKKVEIAGEVIGDYESTFIVAEAGINHNGDLKTAKELIVAAKECGANAVKFQAFTADRMCDLDLEETKDVEALTGGTKSSFDMYKSVELSDEDIIELKEFAEKEGILFFLSVFDEDRVDFLDSINISCFKISSGDLTHLPLLRYAASKQKPMIISTGMATLEEVKKAVSTIESEGNTDIVILHCTADYPPKDEEVNLAVLATLQKEFDYPIGFSDHSVGIELPLASGALRSTMIEKHFTLDRNADGPDHKLSADPEQLKHLVAGIRKIELARGSSVKEPTPTERKILFNSRRGIKVAKDLKAGIEITLDMLKIIKPSAGIHPEHMMEVVGMKLKKDMVRSEALEWDHLD